MTKALLLSVLALLFSVTAKAQCQNFEWAKRLDVGRVSERVITDAAGNIFTLGNNVDQNIFINTESFITKHNAQGTMLWTSVIANINIITANSDYSVKAYDFVLDNAGNVYIAGWFMQHVDFNPGAATYQISSDTYTSGFETRYGRNAFVAKLDANGNFVWAKKYGDINGGIPDEFWAISIDNAGNIYASGQNNGATGLLYKINSANGNIIWQKNTEGLESRITTDNNNNVYLTGYFQGTKDFDPDAGVYNLTSKGSKDAYVMKLNSTGNFEWANQLGGAGDDAGKSLTTDNAGNVFITGSYYNMATYMNGATTMTLPAGQSPNRNGYIAKLNTSDGNFMWASWFREAPGVSGSITEEGCGIALDQSENVYVTGHFRRSIITSGGHSLTSNSPTIFLFQLNNSNGNYTWLTSLGGTAADWGKDIAVDKDDNVLVTGLYNDRLTVNGYPQTFPPQDSIDFDPSPNSAYYLYDNGGYANRFLLKLKNKKTAAISHSICQGNAFDFNGTQLSNAGVYADTLASAAGCDSIVTLTLNVFPHVTDSLFITINQGDAYDFNGTLINSAGVYTNTLMSVHNCDSVVVLTLSVDNVTGINSITANREFKLYPNPTNGMVYFSEMLHVKVSNALGQIVSDAKNLNSINLSDQPKGIYILTFTDNSGQVLQRSKIVKE